jgi:CubicO group peptidase (beta-lactamase class C family)
MMRKAGPALLLVVALAAPSGAARRDNVEAPGKRARWSRSGSQPGSRGKRTRAIRAIGFLLQRAIADASFPGAAVVVGRGDEILLSRGFGKHSYGKGAAVSTSSVYDLASLTKVVATTTAAMKLYEAGVLSLDAPLSRYLPELANGPKGELTMRQLLTHTAGFGGYPHDQPLTRDALLHFIAHGPLEGPPGVVRYSDLGMIVAGQIIERLTGESLASFCAREIFLPLGMKHTGFRGVGRADREVVPTEQDEGARNRLLQGEVHDEKASVLGGVAGHAGLFSTAEDLTRFGRMLVGRGELDGRSFLRPETITAFLSGGTGGRLLGWEKKVGTTSSAGRRFGPRSYGHTGFTGTSMWIDPDQGLFAILLTNRVHPSRKNDAIKQVRPRVADLAFEAIEP